MDDAVSGKRRTLGDFLASAAGMQKPITLDEVLQAESRLHREHVPPQVFYTKIPDDIDIDKHLAQAMQYGSATISRAPVQASLTTYTDAEMVMDMIRRGYAVMKLPEGGGPPDMLRES